MPAILTMMTASKAVFLLAGIAFSCEMILSIAAILSLLHYELSVFAFVE
jgi:hypothetical protein